MLHTDVEDSTPLTVQLGDRYPEILAVHRALLRAAFSAHEGLEVDTQGDSFFVVFGHATQAIAAAVAIQRALAVEAWPEGGAVRVRIGVHTGEPIRTADGYTGLDVVRGARIKEAGHGGQVLLSKSTAALIEDALTGGLSLRDLGSHRLKGLPRPERIFQLIIPDLPADFPPLQSLDTRGRARPGLAAGRALTTVLFVDIPGATARLVALGDRRWREVQAQYTALVRQELARYGGEEVNAVADEIFAVFDGAVAAIRCGCAIRDAVRGLGIAVRVGIHAGEVEYDDGTISGIAVNTGSRIIGAAQPGEVLVSNTVKDLMAGSGFTFTDRGTHTFKGLPGKWRLFAPDVGRSCEPS
ncbi:MAG TPA: adenylate/guanylate cyclase domain-containing protein [Methylomirabilota bacterium]|nr:adenylate/guanylate cyclase domain-containing protein [Methylomirabilota bacterium]